MQYKTITLELLKQQQSQKKDLTLRISDLDRCSALLAASHQEWLQTLSQARPASDPRQTASEALELALKELQDHLQENFLEEDETLSLDGAMAYLRRRTPPA